MNTKLQLTIQPSNSKLDKLKLIELINVDTLDSLINSSLLKQTFNNPCANTSYDNERQQLIKYKQLIQDGKASIQYKKAKDMQFGRVSPNKALGLFSIRREIRHTLARDNYVDIDIENCHPVLLLQILQANNIECKYLKQYVNKRDEKLDEVKQEYGVDRDKAKKMFIQLMYFGKFESWAHDIISTNKTPSKFISKFSDELQKIGAYIEEQNPVLSKQLKKRKKEQGIDKYNEKGTLVSYFLQEYENQILETIFYHCTNSGYISDNTAVLCADGLMISKKNYDVKLLDELHDVIKTKFGFKLVFTEKAMNQGYTTEQIQASQKPISEQEEFLVDEGVFNDLEAARLVFKLYPHWVCCHSELYVFDDKTGLWSNEEQAHMQIISKFDKYLYLMMPTKDGDYKKGTKGYGNSTTLQRQMIPQLKILCINNDWLKDSENTSLKKLLFLDGYLDLVTGIFFEIYNPKIVFMNRIQQRYQNKSVDESYIEDLKQRLFNNPLGSEVGNYFLLSISRGLAGDVMKKIVFGLGGTNGGKSTITKACVNSFGEYVSSFNAENLSYNKSSTDEAAKLRWAMLLRFKRLIFSNEIKNTVELNGNDIKKISSGGDTLIGSRMPIYTPFSCYCSG